MTRANSRKKRGVRPLRLSGAHGRSATATAAARQRLAFAQFQLTGTPIVLSE